MNFRVGDQRMLNGHKIVFRGRRGNHYLQWWDTVDHKIITTSLHPTFDRKSYERLVMVKQPPAKVETPPFHKLIRLAEQNNLTVEEALEAFR